MEVGRTLVLSPKDIQRHPSHPRCINKEDAKAMLPRSDDCKDIEMHNTNITYTICMDALEEPRVVGNLQFLTHTATYIPYCMRYSINLYVL
jgi:hypothetical protein